MRRHRREPLPDYYAMTARSPTLAACAPRCFRRLLPIRGAISNGSPGRNRPLAHRLADAVTLIVAIARREPFVAPARIVARDPALRRRTIGPRNEGFENLDRAGSALVYAFRIDCCAVLRH